MSLGTTRTLAYIPTGNKFNKMLRDFYTLISNFSLFFLRLALSVPLLLVTSLLFFCFLYCLFHSYHFSVIYQILYQILLFFFFNFMLCIITYYLIT